MSRNKKAFSSQNNKSNSPIKSPNTLPAPVSIPQPSLMSSIKDAVVYSTVFNATNRIFDSMFGGRKIEVVNQNSNHQDNNCDKIIDIYKNTQDSKLEELYNNCIKKN
jgi:hypothetical protein